MYVVAAGVHDGLLDFIGRVNSAYRGGIGERGLLFDGESVEVGTEKDCRARVARVGIGEDGSDAVAADGGMDGVLVGFRQ